MPTPEEDGVLERIGQRLFTLRVTVVLARNLDGRRPAGIDDAADDEYLRQVWDEYVPRSGRGGPVRAGSTSGQARSAAIHQPPSGDGGGAEIGPGRNFGEIVKDAKASLMSHGQRSASSSSETRARPMDDAKDEEAVSVRGRARSLAPRTGRSADLLEEPRELDEGILRRIVSLGEVLKADESVNARAAGGGAPRSALPLSRDLRTPSERETDALDRVNRRLIRERALALEADPIVLQTIITIDGDVTTRISEAWLDAEDDPDGRRLKTALELQHMGIQTAVSWWSNLVELVGKVGANLIRLALRR